MGIKITGLTLLWTIVLVAGFLLARNWLHEQFRDGLIAELQDTDKYAVFPESPSMPTFDKPLDFTRTQPIFSEGVLYRPEQE